MSAGENIKKLVSSLPAGTGLVAVSKFHTPEEILGAYRAGQRMFGESYVKELLAKYEALPRDIAWHFIGHLQTNKVRQIVPFVSLIESVDSARLVCEIQKQAFKAGRVVDTLLEIHVAKEESKTGFPLDDCTAFLESFDAAGYPNVRIRGLMTMASNTDDRAVVRDDFRRAADYFAFAKNRFFPSDDGFSVRSWGMSGDYLLALEEGSTLVRIGTKIFGPRS